METLYIVIGALSSTMFFLLGYAVIGVVNGKKQAETLENYIKAVDYKCESIERLIENEVSVLNLRVTETHKVIDSELDQTSKMFHSALDSRLNKLEHKLKETQVTT